MEIDEKLIAEVTRRVMEAVSEMNASAPAENSGVAAESAAPVLSGGMTVTDLGPAEEGKYPDEVVIGLAPRWLSIRRKLSAVFHTAMSCVKLQRVLRKKACGYVLSKYMKLLMLHLLRFGRQN